MTATKPPAIPEEVRAEMQRQNVTTSQLAEKVSVNRRTLANWLAGTHPMTVGMLDRIAKALGTTGSAILAEAERHAA